MALLVCATPPAGGAAAKSIPIDQLGAEAQKQYTGDGVGITPTAGGARLRAAFQDLAAEATPDGLWLESTADEDAGKATRFRVRAVAIGREGGAVIPLADRGQVRASGETALYLRAGLIEEYTVSMDGVRQDFVLPQRPSGTGEIQVELAVDGARAETSPYGAKLILDGNGREIAYNRLHVTDAKGRELSACMDVTDPSRIRIQVDDSIASYPLRIDPTFSDADWVSLDGSPGADGTVRALTFDDSGNLYIGGDFRFVGNLEVNRIAKWNGSTWSSLSYGANGPVYALASSPAGIYVGGEFTAAYGMGNYISRWTGSSWFPLGSGMDGAVHALLIANNELYAGGSFTTAGGVSANRCAKWSGNAWSALGSGMDGTVYSLAASSTGASIFAGGAFSRSGTTNVNRVARWNGTTWSALGSGMSIPKPYSASVHALAVSGTDLYAGGVFLTAGGETVNGIAKWNGTAWSGLGLGMNGRVNTLAVAATSLYAGGTFTTAGGTTCNRIAGWTGTNWVALSTGLNNTVYSLAVSGTTVFAGGEFTSAGDQSIYRVAKWDGGGWIPMGPPLGAVNGEVCALAVSGTDLYVGGYFTAAGGSEASNIAKWNGSAWTPLGTGVDNKVLAMAATGGNLYVGGKFVTAGGVTVNGIAKWNGSSWMALGSGLGASYPSDPWTYALAVSGADLYVGGDFTAAGGLSANRIAKWNGSNWSILDSGMNGTVQALAMLGTQLYAGGSFTTAGGAGIKYIARWNGTVWINVGTGMNSTVLTLAASGTCLYAGGWFTTADGMPANRIACWDGSHWSALGAGLNGVVHALAVSGPNLYAGGAFNFAGVQPANHIAMWDGISWNTMASGVDDRVQALALMDDDLYVGGLLHSAGGKAAGHLARVTPQPAPEIAVETAGRPLADGVDTVQLGTVPCGSSNSAAFTIRNEGNLDLQVTSVSVVSAIAGFTVDTVGMATLLAPGASTTFTVIFAPMSARGFLGTLRIASNDENENPFDIELNGTGFEDTFAAWVALTGLTGDDALPDAEPFGDGVSNFMKYAFNLEPDCADARRLVPGTGIAGLPVLTRDDSGEKTVFRFEFIRRISGTAAYVPMQSCDMSPGSWVPATGAVTRSRIDPIWERLVVETPYDPASMACFFTVKLLFETYRGFVLVPAGPFTMGDSLDSMSDAAPVTVTLSAFHIAVNEVTLSQWQAVYVWATSNGYEIYNAGAGKSVNHPVHTVDWYNVVKWCNARSEMEGLTPVYYTDTAQTTIYQTGVVNITNAMVKWTANGYRLPTEAEWEKSARGGLAGQRFPWGVTITQNLANYFGNTSYSYDLGPNNYHPLGNDGTTPYTTAVGTFAANGYGLHDMAGNVQEWCWDRYGTYAGGSDPRGSTTDSSRLLRGGSWNSQASYARCAYRNNLYPGNAVSDFGFRPARSSVP